MTDPKPMTEKELKSKEQQLALDKLLFQIEQKKAEIADLEKKKAETKIELPTSDIKGNIALDKDVIGCQVLAYKAMSDIAAQIAKEIIQSDPKLKQVVIYNQADFDMILSYTALKQKIDILIGDYNKVLPSKAEPSLVDIVTQLKDTTPKDSVSLPVPDNIKSLVDIASLLKIDTEIHGNEVSIVTEALIAEIARKSRSFNIRIINSIFMTHLIKSKTISDLLDKQIAGDIERKKINDDNNDTSKKLKELSERSDTIKGELGFTDEKTKISTLERFVKGELLSMELKKQNTCVLYLKNIAASGNNKITRNLLWSSLTHSGGAIITYFLVDQQGEIKASKNLYSLTGYTKFAKSVPEIINAMLFFLFLGMMLIVGWPWISTHILNTSYSSLFYALLMVFGIGLIVKLIFMEQLDNFNS